MVRSIHQGVEIHLRLQASQHACILQALQAPPAGILRKADAFSQFTLRQAAILLQAGENASINMVDSDNFIVHLIEPMGYFRKNR